MFFFVVITSKKNPQRKKRCGKHTKTCLINRKVRNLKVFLQDDR